MSIEKHRSRHVGIAASLGLLASGSVIVAGCPGRLDDIDRYKPKPPGAFVCPDTLETFVARCGQDVCHGSMNPAASLDLVSPGVAERVVGAAAKGCGGALVDIDDPEASLFYTKLAEPMPSCGLRMPLGGAAFTEDELGCVKTWIASLAPVEPDAGCAQCVCIPGTVESCYSGPEGTEGVGICKPGTRTCNPEGLTWSACEGEVLPAMEECLQPEDEDCDGNAPECPQTWSKSWGDVLTQYARGVDVDGAGNVYVVGDFEGTVDFGGGPLTSLADKSDVFLVKHDKYGNFVWAHRFGDASSQYALGLAVDASGAATITGRVFGSIDFGGGPLQSAGLDDVFVAKLDADGNHVWSERFGSAEAQRGERVDLDPAGNPVVVGEFAGSMTAGAETITSAGLNDAFALKLDGATGAPLWATRIGGAGEDQAQGVGIDAQGATFVAGRFSGAADAGGVALSSAGLSDAFVAKLGSSGSVIWAKAFGGADVDQAYDVAVEAATGQAVVVGAFSTTINFGGAALTSAGSRDYFVAKLDGLGGHVWSKRFGDATDQLVGEVEANVRMSVAVNAQGGAVVSGSLSGAADFGGGPVKSAGKLDVFVAWLGKGGEHVGSKAFGTAGTQTGLDVAADGPYAIVVGRYLGSMSFGFGTHVSLGDSDAFVAKVAP
ncbi:nucleotide-binding protein [Polyangium aurulentum]|uniref:nucleotide-binding protein n=1 Tax=Polyangium aurulentum TaxID=2567896 RepID=UPI0010AE3431|nr:nucleotide-binding protein [Polyangium aurulentum]UQA55527.1 nucleotide-binding protein [Polyangium aurulentum]